MITITKNGNAVLFEFEENQHYLYNGTIEVPLNSLSLVTDESEMFTFKKAATNDIFISARYDDVNMSKSQLIDFYIANMVGSTGGGSESGITSGDVESMIEASLEDYYDIDEIDAALSGKADTSAVTESINAAVSGKADTSAVTAVNSSLTAHTSDTDIHTTAVEKAAWNAKSDFSGSYNDLTDKPTIPTVPTSNTAFTNDAGYITDAALEPYAMTSAVTNSISAATDDMATKTWVGEQGYITGVDLSNYATNDDVTAAVSGKADTSSVYTKSEVDTSLSGKQATLVSGANIKTINNESILGEGNITIEGGGGGKAINAGRGISVTTGETADTVSFNLPISAGTRPNSLIIGDTTNISTSNRSIATGYNTKAQQSNAFAQGYKTDAGQAQSHAEGYETKAYGVNSHSEGRGTSAMTLGSHAEGLNTITSNSYEHTQGQYNVSSFSSSTFGDSGNTLFSVGNGTADNARHNAFEIRQNGDIYITKDGQDVKLQDQLGGGVSESAFTAYSAATDARISEDEEVTAAALNALNDGKQDTLIAGSGITISGNVISAEGGNLVIELTQAEYDALVDKDPNAFYIITDATEINISDYYTSAQTQSAINAAVSGKQDTLVAGNNITISGNVISATGGGGVTVDQSLDSGSTNAVANSAITTAINAKENHLTDYIKTWELKRNYDGGRFALYFTYRYNDNEVTGWFPFANINSKSVASGTNFSLVETSAITTSIASSSTDAQVPSAKAVYDALQESGGGGVSESAFTSYSAATDARMSEDEEVTAAALNALNDRVDAIDITVDDALDATSENPVQNKVIYAVIGDIESLLSNI